MTGQENLGAPYDAWDGFHAAHIFPLGYIDRFSDYKPEFNITIPGKNGDINSVQNGMLLRMDLHGLFDQYNVSICPSVCVFAFNKLMANDDFRTITRSCFFAPMINNFTAGTWIKSFLRTLNALPMPFSDGILSRRS
jgi:hypothetical protein